jgi:hypothetical protein
LNHRFHALRRFVILGVEDLIKARNMAAIKRADFKSLMSEVIRDAYWLGVRNDLMNAETQKQQCGWKGLRAASLA